MEEKAFNRSNVSKELYGQFKQVQSELKRRGVEVTFLDFSVFVSKQLNDAVLNQYVDEVTPDEYKIKEFVSDPKQLEMIKRLMSKSKKTTVQSAESKNE